MTEWRKIIYDDFGKATPKVGHFEREDDFFVYLRLEDGRVEAIAKNRIIRMDIRAGGQNGK